MGAVRTGPTVRTTEFMLTQWGLWAYQNRGLHVYFPGIEPFAKMRPRGMGNGLVIDDQDGKAMDALVGLLRQDNYDEYDALARHYLAGQSYRKIAEAQGHRDFKRAERLISGGRRFIDGMLAGN